MYAAGDADRVNERVLALIEERRIASPPGGRRGSPAGSPPSSPSGSALDLDPAEMAAALAALVGEG